MKDYPPSPVPEYGDFKSALQGISQYAQKPAVTTFTRTGEPVLKSYETLANDAKRLGEALLRRGYRHVAIAARNSYEWIAAFWATVSSGMVAILIDIEQPDDTILYMIRHADADVTIASEEIAPILHQAGMPGISVCEGTGFETMAQLIAENEEQPLWEKNTVKPEDPAAIVYTSGTTSLAKAVLFENRNLLKNAAISVAQVAPPERIFTPLPLYHIFSISCAVLGNQLKGKNVGVGADPRFMLRDLARFRGQTLMAVPLIIEAVYKTLIAETKKRGVSAGLRKRSKKPVLALTQIKEELFPELHESVCGGAHLKEEIAKELLQYDFNVLLGYGITECGGIASSNRNLFHDTKSVGTLAPTVQVRVYDGEILLRSQSMLKEYYKDPEATKEAWFEGWFKTGDLGYMDQKGRLYITGRKKNLIVLKNGKKIAPEEIEEKLAAIPMVAEAVAYGASSGDAADDVKLAVMIYPSAPQTAGMSQYEVLGSLQKEIDAINETLPSYKQIEMLNLREKPFDKTPSGKIIREVSGKEKRKC